MSTPNKIGYPMGSAGLLTDIDAAARDTVGKRQFGDDGGEYIYLPGVASLAAGDFVMFGGSLLWTTARLLNDAGAALAGQVAVAMAAVLATQFGWFQIYGITQPNANIATTSSVGFSLFRTSTAGRAAVSAVAKDCIFGAYTAAASASNVGQAFLAYPVVTDNSTL